MTVIFNFQVPDLEVFCLSVWSWRERQMPLLYLGEMMVVYPNPVMPLRWCVQRHLFYWISMIPILLHQVCMGMAVFNSVDIIFAPDTHTTTWHVLCPHLDETLGSESGLALREQAPPELNSECASAMRGRTPPELNQNDSNTAAPGMYGYCHFYQWWYWFCPWYTHSHLICAMSMPRQNLGLWICFGHEGLGASWAESEWF